MNFHEKLYRQLFEQSRDAITIVDQHGRFIDANPAFLSMMNYTLEEILGINAATLWVDPSERKVWSKVLKQEGSHVDFESRQRTKDGRELDLLLTSTAQPQENSKVVYLTILRDITQRKRIERERDKLIDDLKNALSEVKVLSGLLPICANCKKIRDDKGYWNKLESYLEDRSEIQFSHGICPDCVKKLYPSIDPEDSEA